MPFLSPSLFEELALEESLAGRLLFSLCGNADILYGVNILLNGLRPIAADIPCPRPALYDGAHPTEIDERIKHDLQHLIMPSAANPEAPAVPNFFLQVRPSTDDENSFQTCARYVGALGARAMHRLQNYGRKEPMYHGNAHTFTSNYDPQTGILNIYTHYVTVSKRPGLTDEYHMAELGSWNLMSNKETFVQGVTALRNLRDLAKAYRGRVIEEANTRAWGSA